MKPVIHIGPPKTASTSIQSAVIPLLGRPYVIKPAWARDFCRGAVPSCDLPEAVILSDERLGEFSIAPPKVIAARMAQLFPNGGKVIYVSREPADLMKSLFRQQIINLFSFLSTNPAPGRLREPQSFDEYFDMWRPIYDARGVGAFAMVRPGPIRTAFAKYFELVEIPFALLRNDSATFVEVFSTACGKPMRFDLPVENVASLEVLDSLLSKAVSAGPPDLLQRYRDTYEFCTLSADRRAVLDHYRDH